jgi:hypothetical protein
MRVKRIFNKGTSTTSRVGPHSIDPNTSVYSVNMDAMEDDDEDEVRRVGTEDADSFDGENDALEKALGH